MQPEILFEDDDLLVVSKPAGMLVHPAPGHEGAETVTDFFVRHCPKSRTVGSESRPGIVHRLDQDTSGVMVMAKTQRAYLHLRRQFERHVEVHKTYLAVCHGSPRPPRGTITLPVGRPPQTAISHYEVLSRHDGLSLVEFKIETGRMHQIRIHAKALNCPLAGDGLYGDRVRDRRLRRRPTRTLLHAVELSFLHPVTGRRVTFACPPPNDLIYAG